jgi:NADH-ubiquinone oxidoreductase chain 1
VADNCEEVKFLSWVYTPLILVDLGVIFGEIVMIILVLVGVAFVTLLERKILGYIQLRRGPNRVGYLGVVQPFADAVRLFRKEIIILKSVRFYVYIFSPGVGLVLFFFVWCVFPILGGSVDFYLGLLYFFCLRRLGVYILFGCGWSSNSFYSLIGALRGVAQIVSYEVRLIFIVLSCVVLTGSFDFEDVSRWQEVVWYIILLRPLGIIWFVSCLAETNRTPFDFAEGESELVSGFNVEYGAFGFAFIFIREYGVIIIISVLVIVLFFGGLEIAVLLGWVIVRLWIWVRGAYPRFRYDRLISLSWRVYLPVSLNFLFWAIGLRVIARRISNSSLRENKDFGCLWKLEALFDVVIISLALIIGGLVRLLGSYRRVINILLRFEIIMLGLLYFLGVWLRRGLGDSSFMLGFIVFIVGEGVLGLGILVRLIRCYGEDRRLGLRTMLC